LLLAIKENNKWINHGITLIIIKDLSLAYPQGKTVLDNISFYLAQGSFYFLTGKSGAGKTSFLKMLSLSMKHTEGYLEIFGEDADRISDTRLPYLKRRTGLVYQDFRLLNHLTVQENVALPLKVSGESKKEIREKTEEIMRWIGLTEYAHERPEILSGGQKQRVAIARAVINKPDLILADEPTGNLDPQLALKFMHLFETLHQDGTTIIIATHDESLISKFSHHKVLRLEDGKLKVQKSKTEITKERVA